MSSPPPETKKPGVALIEAVALVFTSLVETFGWPGATVILSFGFVIAYATTEQKQRIVETYVLGTGIGRLWPMLLLAFLFAATSLAQARLYKRKLAKMSAEIEREGKEKSSLQEKRLHKKLHHGQTTTAKPRKR